MSYIKNILVSVDQLLNTLLFGNPDETISSRIGKYIRRRSPGWVPNQLNSFLDLFEKDHCIKSIEDDEISKTNDTFILDVVTVAILLVVAMSVIYFLV